MDIVTTSANVSNSFEESIYKISLSDTQLFRLTSNINNPTSVIEDEMIH